MFEQVPRRPGSPGAARQVCTRSFEQSHPDNGDVEHRYVQVAHGGPAAGERSASEHLAGEHLADEHGGRAADEHREAWDYRCVEELDEEQWDEADDAALLAVLAAGWADGSLGGEFFGADLEARLRHAIAVPGGHGVTQWLSDLEPERLDAHHRVLLARAWEGQRRYADARYQQTLAVCLDPEPRGGAGHGGPGIAHPVVAELEEHRRAEELRLALGLSRGQLCYQSRQARALLGDFSRAWSELAAGRMSSAQVRELLLHTRAVSPEMLPEVLDRVLAHAPDQTSSALRATIRRAVAAVLPDLAAREFDAARAQRGVELRHDEIDEVGPAGERVVRESTVTAHTDPVQAARIHQLIEGEARRLRAAARHHANVVLDRALSAHRGRTRTAPGDRAQPPAGEVVLARAERTRVYAIPIGAWRVDALEHLLEVGTVSAREGEALRAHGRPVELVVSVSMDTLTGLSVAPAELRGYGALPAPVLGELATAASRWLVVITDRDGAPIGTERYRPTRAMQDWITAVHPTCTAPHCTTSVEWCERDHTDPYDHDDPTAGGQTDTTNTRPRCGPCHDLKTHGGFTVTLHDDGWSSTTTPAGHTYWSPPPEVLATTGLTPVDHGTSATASPVPRPPEAPRIVPDDEPPPF